MTCYSCYKYLLLHLKRFVYRCFLIATIGNVYLKNGRALYGDFYNKDSTFYRYVLDIQNYLTTFVAETVALESVDPKCKKQEAGTNHIIYSLVATKIRFFQLFLCRMVYRHFICLMNLLSFFLL